MRWNLLISLTVLGFGAVSVYASYARDLAAARGRLLGRSSTLGTSYGVLEYSVVGTGEPVIIIHGAAGGFDQALDVTEPLAASGFQLIAPSRFGYLGSSLPARPTVGMQADAYVELLDHLGIAKVDVVSISAGAWSTLQLAIRHPERVRALVLLVPADYLPPGMSIHGGAIVRSFFNSDFIAWAQLKLMPILPGGMFRMILGTDHGVVDGASPAEKARVQQILERLLPVSSRVGGMNFDVATAADREPYALEKITCPVLAISSDDDRFGTALRAKYIASHVKQGKTVIYPTGGHALVGHYTGTLNVAAAFLHTLVERE